METFSFLLQTKESLIGVVTAIFTVIYVFAAQKFLLANRERRKTRETQLFDTISQGIRNGALESVEDLINVYKGVYTLGTDDISHRAGLAKVLREYIVKIVSDATIDSQEAKDLKEFATIVIKKIESESPFAELPAAERNLLLDVERFIKAADQASASAKLQDLAGLIEVRQDSMNRLQSSNKWSVPLAVIGLVFTIIFGIVSLIK
ncbi:hypothetical protein ACSX1C_00800 [Pseudomonas sp. MBLB4123]|uniref:hypothetical protein n=1 Tax=Pseudomonas sp. MBLB4123 TaxID=3451557 RepID=UPI003F750031